MIFGVFEFIEDHPLSTFGGAAAGKSAVDVFGKVNKTLATAAKSDDTTRLSPGPAAASSTPQPEPIAPPDLTALVTGMDRAELVAKAGKPSMSVTSTEASTLVETCWYRAGANSVTVILRNGKVASIAGAEKLAAK